MSEEDLQQQADECEALASIYPEEFAVVPTDTWAAFIAEAGWSDDVTQLVSVNVQPQEEDPAKIHGE
jgi:tRNA A37 threonylcarbamoyladenosine synthetase subunit TsaC/SUA5/YrdC